MGLNFHCYDGLQPKMSPGIINENECIFGQTISTHFGSMSPLSMFSIIQPLFLQKSKPLYPHASQIFIWDWDLNLGCKELGI